jgi:hypothetical protein
MSTGLRKGGDFDKSQAWHPTTIGGASLLVDQTLSSAPTNIFTVS